MFHYMFEDNTGTRLGTTYQDCTPANGNAVYDYVLYGNATGKAFFAFINTCMSADYNNAYGVVSGSDSYPSYTQGILPDGTARGMAFAWTHRIVATNPVGNQMSSDGYHATDNGDNCYIGFDYGSAALDQTIENSDYHYYYWVYHFFHYALECDYAIHTALDLASQDTFYYHPNFDESPLYTGFTAIWRMYIDGAWRDSWEGFNFTMPNCHMKVYGNAYLKLYQPLLTLSANGGLSPTFTIDGQSYSTGNHRVISDVYTINVDDIHNYAFSHFNYKNTNYGRPANIQIASDGELTAVYNWDPTYYNLSISSSAGGYTTPSGTQEYLSYTDAEVEAIPNNDNWIFDHWLLDGEDAGMQNPIKVTMDDDHALQAVFTTAPSYKFVTSINDYNQYATNPQNLVGWKNDSQLAELIGYGPYQQYGWIEATLNAQATGGHIYMYGCCAVSGYEGHLYVYVSNDGNSWTYVSAPYVSATSPYWIDCGLYENNFSYIAVTVENTGEFPWIGIDSVRVEPIAYYNLTISAGTGGTTDPSPGVHEYQEGTQIQVTADANDNYVFDHWLLDGNTYTDNPITVTMNDDRTLQAFFTYAPSHYWASSISDYGGPVTNPTYILGSETDGQFAVLEGYGPYQYYGWIEAAMDSQATGHIYMYGCAQSYGHLYVYVSSNGYNWNYVGAPYVSSSSPYWIDCGTYQSTFNYIAVTVENPYEFPIIGIDSVRVEP